MTDKSLATILLKLLGVYCIVRAVDFVSQIVRLSLGMALGRPSLSASEWLSLALSWLPSAAILGVLAFVLLRHADALASRLTSVDDSSPVAAGETVRDPFVISMIVAGVVILAWHVPAQVAGVLTNAVYAMKLPDESLRERFASRAWDSGVRGVLYLAVGAFLILGARRIRDIITRLRGLRDRGEDRS